MIRRPPRSTLDRSSAASDVYKRQLLEEAPGGMYDICEALTKEQTADLLERLEQTTPVPVHPPNAHPIAVDSANRAMVRAGFDLYLEGGSSQGPQREE